MYPVDRRMIRGPIDLAAEAGLGPGLLGDVPNTGFAFGATQRDGDVLAVAGELGLLQQLARASNKRLLFYCSFGERSAMAVQAAQSAGLTSARHIHGGMQAWKSVEGPLQR